MGSSSGSDNNDGKWQYFENAKIRSAIPELDTLTPNDQVTIPFIVQSICAHRNWPYEAFKPDVEYLNNQFIRILADLHVLRKQSFDQLQITPILRDLLFKISLMSYKYLLKQVKSINFKQDKNVDYKLGKDDLITKVEERQMTPAEIAKSFLTGKTSTVSVQATSIQVAPSNPKKLIVNANGINYECERFCPHKNVDMLHGYVEGNNLICQKHGWAFNLANGGVCSEKNKTVHACQLEW